MGYLKEVNIKYDMPTADLAVRRTTYAIENGRTLGASAVKLIPTRLIERDSVRKVAGGMKL